MKRFLLMALLLIISILLVGGTWLLTQKESPLFRPIQEYKMVSKIHHLKPSDIDQVMQAYLGHSFWEVDLESIQSKLVHLDWVNTALVKRSWPDQLYVSVEEQKAVARWGEAGLVNQAGEVFYPQALTGFQNLVVLEGDLSDSATILLKLVEFQRQLITIDFTISRLKRQLDGVWQMDLLNGSRIVLETASDSDKLEQFIRAYPKLSNALRKSPQVYDLRYSNGFIVGKADGSVSQ